MSVAREFLLHSFSLFRLKLSISIFSCFACLLTGIIASGNSRFLFFFLFSSMGMYYCFFVSLLSKVFLVDSRKYLRLCVYLLISEVRQLVGYHVNVILTSLL